MTTTDPKLIERASLIAEQAYSAGNLVTCDGYYEFDLDAAAAVIAAAINEAAHQWQDIATAPSKCCIDVWVTLSGGYRLAECYYDTICGQWRTSRPSGQLICIPERHVSHWMPMPSPPAIEAKESQHG